MVTVTAPGIADIAGLYFIDIGHWDSRNKYYKYGRDANNCVIKTNGGVAIYIFLGKLRYVHIPIVFGLF